MLGDAGRLHCWSAVATGIQDTHSWLEQMIDAQRCGMLRALGSGSGALMPKAVQCSPCRLPSGRNTLPYSWKEAALGCSSASLVSGTCGVCELPYQPASGSWPAGA